MSNWLVAIVGGVIATVAGGLILFHILPPQRAPAPPSLAPALSIGASGRRHLKCTMRGGPMSGRVYSFSIDVTRKEAVWTDYRVKLKVGVDEQKIWTSAKFQLPGSGWPKHNYISFDFNRFTLGVRSSLGLDLSADGTVSLDVSADGTVTISPPPDVPTLPPGFVLDVGESDGECVEVSRAF